MKLVDYRNKTKFMNIIADENIPGVKKAFASLGNVHTLPGREIVASDLKSADILLVRSVTVVDEKLLINTPVKYVGSATIGEDHIDTAWLKKNGIAYANAPGSNAQSVAEYVINAIINYCLAFDKDLSSLTIGIIGAGHVGTSLKVILDKLKIKVLVNDPLKELQEKKKGHEKAKISPGEYVEFEEILQADILTLHTPLVLDGEYPTRHKINYKVLNRLCENGEKLIINTARGGVIDNAALLNHLTKSRGFQAILDVWENEPDINTDLMDKCFLATPHIAGYSLDGKLSGTQMIYRAACDHFKTRYEEPDDFERKGLEKEAKPIRLQFIKKPNESSLYAVARLLNEIYPIQDDDELLRQLKKQDAQHRASYFDNLRKNYRVRREFSNYSIATGECRPEDIQMLQGLGFQLEA